jgi:hypothetical protein
MTKGYLLSKSLWVVRLCIFLLLIGCTTEPIVAYEGPILPKDKIAIITSPYYGFWTINLLRLDLNCIDGKGVPRLGQEIQVLPGMHQIQINVKHGYVVTESPTFGGNIEFEALANHEYLANGQIIEHNGSFFGVGASYSALIWVEDTSTKQIVAQAVPTQLFKQVNCQ